MAVLPSCPRCGAVLSAGTAIACTACGAPLPAPGEETASIDVPRRPPGRRSLRLTVAPFPVAPSAGPRAGVRHRHLSPPLGSDGMDYGLGAVLGEGGMGVVWSAQQAGLGREVAVKRVRPAAGARAAEQLLAEAVLTGSLEHPGIVPVHEVGFDQDGMPFYTMRRLRGRTWAERWRDLSLREHLDVLLRVCDPVAYAHGQGVLHRDLKPGNVFLGEYGEVVVFDWGLAVRLADVRGKDGLPSVSGTPAYMAPEMARADARMLGPASDVYLLGAILYEILTGVPPHPGEAVEDILVAAADNVIEPPMPAGELGEIAARAMAADPAARYPDVRSFQRALRVHLDHQESVSLAARARDRLEQARRSGQYDDFSRAVHGFEDAAALWDGNAGALAGLAEARLAYARRASDAGDLDLASGLLDDGDAQHRAEAARIAGIRAQRLRRRRALRLLWWVSGALLLALIVALTLGYTAVSGQRDLILRIARERDAAESALVREQAELADGRQRLWHRVLQEDFGGGSLPPLAKVVAGSWEISADALRASGPRPSALVVPFPGSPAVHVQVDVHPGGRGVVLIACTEAEAALGRGRQGVEIAFGERLAVRRNGALLAEAAMPETAAGLPRRLRIECDGDLVRVLVDGVVVLPRALLAGLSRQPLAMAGLHAEPGTMLDNLKIEIPLR